MKTEPFTQDLPHTLSEKEMLAKGAEITRALDQIAHIEAEKKAAVSNFKARTEEQQQNVQRLKTCLNTGEELRPTTCFERMNIVERVIETVRADRGENGEVIDSRPMTADEYQLSLDSAMDAMERKAKQQQKDDAAAIETAGELVNAASNGGKREHLALPADTTAKPKKKGGAERAREKKAAAEAAKASFSSRGKKSALKPEKVAKPATKPAKAKKAKKPKPVLHSERFDADAS